MQIEIGGRVHTLRAVRDDNGSIIYYLKNFKTGEYVKIGGGDPKISDEKIVIKGRTIREDAAEQIKDKLKDISNEEINREADRNKKLVDYAKSNNLELKDMAFLDLEELILDKDDRDDKEDEEEKEEVSEERNKNEQQREEKEEEEEEELEEEDDKDKKEDNLKDNKNKERSENKFKESLRTNIEDVNVEQEVDVADRANDMKNLRQWLSKYSRNGKMIPEDYTRMVVLSVGTMKKLRDENGETYKDPASSMFYDLALVNDDGDVVPLTQFVDLHQRRTAGVNPQAENYNVEVDGDVTKDKVRNSFEIGDTGAIIEIDQENLNIVSVSIGREEVGHRDTMTTELTTDENRELHSNEYIQKLQVFEEHEANGRYTANENIEEADNKMTEDHYEEKDGKKVIDITDADGNEKTDVHSDEIKETIKRIAKAIRETTPEGDSKNDTKKVFTEDQVLEKLKEKFKEITGKELEEVGIHGNKELKEIIKEINEEIEEDAEKINKDREEDDDKQKVPWPTDY